MGKHRRRTNAEDYAPIRRSVQRQMMQLSFQYVYATIVTTASDGRGRSMIALQRLKRLNIEFNISHTHPLSPSGVWHFATDSLFLLPRICTGLLAPLLGVSCECCSVCLGRVMRSWKQSQASDAPMDANGSSKQTTTPTTHTIEYIYGGGG